MVLVCLGKIQHCFSATLLPQLSLWICLGSSTDEKHLKGAVRETVIQMQTCLDMNKALRLTWIWMLKMIPLHYT